MKEHFEPTPVDPSKSSLVEENLQLNKGKGNKEWAGFQEVTTKEQFFPVTLRPELQRLVSYIFKGVINTADIVKQDERYFSHKQKLEQVTPEDDLYEERIGAENFILRYIVGDYDHHYYPPNDKHLQEGDSSEDREHRNLVANEERKNSYHFDFDMAGSPGLGKGEGIHSLQLHTEEDEKDFEKLLRAKLSYSSTEMIQCIKDKTALLLQIVFSPGEFSRFESMVKRAGTVFSERAFDFYKFKSIDQVGKTKELFEDLSKRCLIMNEVASKLLEY